MSRGGKREGAGRPSKITPLLEFQILEDCRRLAWQKRLEQAGRIAEKAAGVSWDEEDEENPDHMINPVHAVPKHERADVSHYGLKEPTAKIPDRLSAEAWRAIDLIRENKRKLEGKPQLYSFATLPGLYGRSSKNKLSAREAIIKQVAKERGVSRRTVRSIWEANPTV
jgi:hypothetical protein